MSETKGRQERCTFNAGLAPGQRCGACGFVAPGGETKHSPEPWTHDPETCPWPGGSVVWQNGLRLFHCSEADGRRIVACVNALAGVPTEALERGRLAEAFDALKRIASLSDDPVARADAESALRALGRLP